MSSYNEYLREWTRDWALRIARRAGVKPGKGGRGKRNDPDKRLAAQLGADYASWLKYKAGKQAPNSSTFKVIHESAIKLGFIGQGDTLEADWERLGPVDELRWLRGLSLEASGELQRQTLLWQREPSLQDVAVAKLARTIASTVPASISG